MHESIKFTILCSCSSITVVYQRPGTVGVRSGVHLSWRLAQSFHKQNGILLFLHVGLTWSPKVHWPNTVFVKILTAIQIKRLPLLFVFLLVLLRPWGPYGSNPPTFSLTGLLGAIYCIIGIWRDGCKPNSGFGIRFCFSLILQRTRSFWNVVRNFGADDSTWEVQGLSRTKSSLWPCRAVSFWFVALHIWSKTEVGAQPASVLAVLWAAQKSHYMRTWVPLPLGTGMPVEVIWK